MSLTPEQLESRKRGAGGSEAAVVLGLSKFKTGRQLYHEKRGEIEVEYFENDVQRWGRLLEGAVRQEYSERTGRVVRQPLDTLWHPVHDFMCGHPDGITDDGRLLEAKTSVPQLADQWGEPGSDMVPQDYLLQCQHYMVLLDLPVADLAVLINRFDYRIYEIPADRELQEMIIEAERDFMRRVRAGDPPPLDFQHRTAIDVVKKIYPGTNGARIVASSEVFDWRTDMEVAAKIAKEHDEKAKALKARILNSMGEAAVLAFPDGKAIRRKLIEKKRYTVAPTSYWDARVVNDTPLPMAAYPGPYTK
jgi:putative phage-type endonuclease